MGYRSRLGKITKTEKERFSGKSSEDVEAMLSEDEAPYRLETHTELYEIGKYADYGEHTTPFYAFDIYKEFESEFAIMGKEGLKAIITSYHEKILKNYEELRKGTESVENFLNSRIREWGEKCGEWNMLPYYLDEERTDGEIVKSWQDEYAIFNLVYIYRTFDWENDYLIYSAW